MEPIGIFALASKQAEWLTVRQGVVADNIANVNTPNYKTKDVTSFNEILGSGPKTSLPLVTTNPLHQSISGGSDAGVVEVEDRNMKVTASGNSVAIAHELMKSTQIRQDYDMNTGLVKALNQMILMTVRK